MLDVSLPVDSRSLLARSFAACLASLTETPTADLPSTDGDWRTSLGQWRQWLAGKGSGLVELADAQRFDWPGYWIAVVGGQATRSEPIAVPMFGTPAGVVLSPASTELLGRPSEALPVTTGYVVAGLDPAPSAGRLAIRSTGVVEAIAVADLAMAPMRLVSTVQALAGRGLQGDRYATRAGTFTPRDAGARGYDLTLIEAEVLEDMVLPSGQRLGFAESRRNVLTRGVDLNALVGRRFRVGDVECVGQRYCEPCAHLERLTKPGTIRGLIHRGGLRADLLTSAELTVGARIES